MIPLRLVVDTRILVSATLNPDGLVLLLAIIKPTRLYVSNAILREYRGGLSRPEFQIRKGARRQLLDLMGTRAHLVNLARAIQVAHGSADDEFIEGADAARAGCVVRERVTLSGRTRRPSHFVCSSV